MSRFRKSYFGKFGIVLLVIVLLFSLVSGCNQSENKVERISIQFNTPATGSAGYVMAGIMTEILNRDLPEEYVVTASPYPSTDATTKAVMNGEGNLAYVGGILIKAMLDRKEVYEGFEPEVGEIVHTLYLFDAQGFMVVSASKAHEYNSWADLSGKNAFFNPAGNIIHLVLKAAWDALGYEFQHVEIDTGMGADALRDGSVEAIGGATTVWNLTPWWREIDVRVDLEIVPLSEEEIKVLHDAGYPTMTTAAKNVFSQDMESAEITGIRTVVGYNATTATSKEFVYKMLTVLYEAKEEMADQHPVLKQLGDDFVEMQVAGIIENSNMAVHPGLADFLKDHDAWNDDWTIAE